MSTPNYRVHCDSKNCATDGAAASAGNGSNPVDVSKLNIRPEVLAIQQELIQNRRYLHQHPELSFEEVETAKWIVEQLRSYGVTEIFERVGRTGVVALIRGQKQIPINKQKVIGFRADMDALPIQEIDTPANAPYKSINANVMHACGHDGHMSMLLAAAKILSAKRDEFGGIIKLVFQPAEEGRGGAVAMIEDGVLEEGKCGPRIDEIYGIHLWNYEPSGVVGIKQGPLMAASDKFYINITGSGGHGAQPQGTNDAIIAAAHLVTMLQSIVSRNLDPIDSAVVTIGQLNSGYNYNIIADKAVLCGTVRTFEEHVQSTIESRMRQIVAGLSTSFNVEAVLDYQYGYPVTSNRQAAPVAAVRTAAQAIVGNELVKEPRSTCCAEDMAYFLQQRPGAFFFVGSAPEATDGTATLYPHHKSNFDIQEQSLLVGASVWVQLALDLLG